MGKKWNWTSRVIADQSLRVKLLLPVMVTMALSLGINLLLFRKMDTAVENMNQVYATNIQLGELEQVLTRLERDIYQYLNVRSQDAFESFGQNREQFAQMIEGIDDTITDHPARRMERNIRNLALSYLELSDSAVKAKQSHDVTKYREDYKEIQKIYTYLLAHIQGLDTLRFKANSENYGVLYQYLRYLKVFMTAVLVGVTCCLMILLYAGIGAATRPLESLAEKARRIGKGDFEVPLDPPENEDEVGTVTTAFNQMIVSINAHIQETRDSMKLQLQMKERELAMENLLKDAQLKYYQAQINPHFLFNTLNAGLQLAMLEDAERTYAFIENMSSFFRYRLKRNGEDSTLGEEIGLIDSYMYIMNVRYSNEIRLDKEIDDRILDALFPGMVLQPVIENALRHGLGEVEWEKRIWFSIHQENGDAVISIRDNGAGISPETLRALQSEEYRSAEDGKESGNGVGLANVRERLRLYFNRKDVMKLESGGEGRGTSITIRVPVIRRGEESYVQDTDRG